ncbi:hypothetical protein [Pseudomonas sp. A014]|uniref:hypothetical protein n=1 Tax=Pseudomonas sp. A014 TaxID=3458058 RepID=UPI00403550F7
MTKSHVEFFSAVSPSFDERFSEVTENDATRLVGFIPVQELRSVKWCVGLFLGKRKVYAALTASIAEWGNGAQRKAIYSLWRQPRPASW